ncbi:hypothetical protein ABW21_db0200472 [Orbilia brochopaga]|nr:hypothetical protein ABW21_db0200472 [Drechslerella brochopaga]
MTWGLSRHKDLKKNILQIENLSYLSVNFNTLNRLAVYNSVMAVDVIWKLINANAATLECLRLDHCLRIDHPVEMSHINVQNRHRLDRRCANPGSIHKSLLFWLDLLHGSAFFNPDNGNIKDRHALNWPAFAEVKWNLQKKLRVLQAIEVPILMLDIYASPQCSTFERLEVLSLVRCTLAHSFLPALRHQFVNLRCLQVVECVEMEIITELLPTLPSLTAFYFKALPFDPQWFDYRCLVVQRERMRVLWVEAAHAPTVMCACLVPPTIFHFGGNWHEDLSKEAVDFRAWSRLEELAIPQSLEAEVSCTVDYMTYAWYREGLG